MAHVITINAKVYEIREERGMFTVYRLASRLDIGRAGMALRTFRTREAAEEYIDARS